MSKQKCKDIKKQDLLKYHETDNSVINNKRMAQYINRELRANGYQAG